MTTLLTTVFLASLLGSVHCAGMCGGIVALCVGLEGQLDRRTRAMALAVYNGGRLVTYIMLGAASGALGAAADLGGMQAGLGRVAPVLAGVGLVLVGLVALGRALGMRGATNVLPPRMQRFMQRGYRLAFTRPPVQRAGIVGLLTGLLPCGWLYAFVVTAAGTGTAWGGALTMAVFWMGTVPIIAALGAGVQTLAGPLRRHLPVVGAMALIIVGVATVMFRFTLPVIDRGSPASTSAGEISLVDLTRDVEEFDHSDLPCCDDEH